MMRSIRAEARTLWALRQGLAKIGATPTRSRLRRATWLGGTAAFSTEPINHDDVRFRRPAPAIKTPATSGSHFRGHRRRSSRDRGRQPRSFDHMSRAQQRALLLVQFAYCWLHSVQALLHAARVIEEAHSMMSTVWGSAHRASIANKLRAWKGQVVTRLTNGLQRSGETTQGRSTPGTRAIRRASITSRSRRAPSAVSWTSSTASLRAARSQRGCRACPTIRASWIPLLPWSCRRGQAPARDRRRNHRSRAGLRLRCVGRQSHRGGAYGWPHAWLRSGSRAPA